MASFQNAEKRFYFNFLLILLICFKLKVIQAQIESETPTNEAQNINVKPNIVIILIDDLGFDDLSFHGSNQILTPNIDALAYNGIILNRLYVPNLCTPSRATLLTGRYTIHTGMHTVIRNDEPWGLPMHERLMPEIFRENGYSTHMVGKWHLGFYEKELTPTMRGFDSHYGYLTGVLNYWDYTSMSDRNYSIGLDMRRNLDPWYDARGTYVTDEFTNEAVRIIESHDVQKPLFLYFSHLAVHNGTSYGPKQAHQEEVDKFQHISDEDRRVYAAKISSVDQSVSRTVEALAEKGIINNTIILLYSDNGAPTVGFFRNSGSNFPFKGQKETPWEGGIHSTGLIWSPLLEKQNYVSNQLIHAADWLPTLAKAAGIQLPSDLQIDGLDLWSSLSQQETPKSRTLLHVLDDEFGYLSYMRDGYKIVNGTMFDGEHDDWFGELARSLEEEDPSAKYYTQTVLSSNVNKLIGISDSKLNAESIEELRAQATWRCPNQPGGFDPSDDSYRCEPLKAPCLFNIDEDPCEQINLAQLKPDVLALLQQDIEAFRKQAAPSAHVSYSDPNCDPKFHNGTWEWWA